MPKVIKDAAPKMTLKVKEFYEAEKIKKGVLIPLNNVRARVAAMTGVYEKTVSRITKEATDVRRKIVTPGKTTPEKN